MPLRLKETLPVIEKLKKENIFAMTEERAEHQDIRQLKIAVLNLMPDKESTELQLLRLLSNSSDWSPTNTKTHPHLICSTTISRFIRSRANTLTGL